MLLLEGGAKELEAEFEWGVEFPYLEFNALMISSVHVLDMVAEVPSQSRKLT